MTLLASSAFPLVLACNSLIGLSDYEKGDCSGGGDCGDGGRTDVVTTDAPNDVRADVAPIDASGTKPVRWPQFKMPNYPQDGGPGENIPTYDGGGGVIVDGVSKLVWLEPVIAGDKTYEEAVSACAAAPGGGWRLPSRIELVTLLDLTPSKPVKIDTTVFPSTKAARYWTSSEVRPDVNGVRQHWVVDFEVGGLGKRDVKATAGVRCIKGQ